VVSPSRRYAPLQNRSLRLGIVALFIGLGLACVDTIWSVYLDTFFHSMAIVGLVSGLLSFIAVLSYFFCSSLLERYPQARLWVIGSIATIVAYILFFLVQRTAIFLLVAVALVIIAVLKRAAFGIIVRDANKLSSIGSAEGMIYALANIGWLLGPLIAGFVAVRLGYRPVFLFAGLFVLFALILFLMINVRPINHHTKDDATMAGSLRNLRSFFSNARLRKVYALSGGISLYWGVLYIYVPLLIIRSGLSSYWIGLFLFAVSVPLALLEYRIGQLADRHGFRTFFIFGYAVLALAGLLAFLLFEIYSIMIIFVAASIGAACLEATRESYFFRITRQSEEERYYGPYLTHMEVFSTIGKLLGAGLLALLAPKFLFLLLSLQMLLFLALATTLDEKAAVSA
jgi:MFS family permease